MKCLIVVFIAITVTEMAAKSIMDEANTYFNSDAFKDFENRWKPYASMYANAIGHALKEGFGHQSMNVYVNRVHDALSIASGYYHSDNQVALNLQNLVLESVPYLYDVEVSMPLPSNLVLVEASVSKMIVHARYILFRNNSNIIFASQDQDSYKSSPFRFQQVRNAGDVAISIEGCSVSGTIVAKLSGISVSLGHSQLRLSECQYNVEIYTVGSAAPPVIANYLLKGEQGLNMDQLLLRPLIDELMPKMQGAMFSSVNTSSILLDNLQKIKNKQAAVFESAKAGFEDIVRAMNQKSIENNMGTITLEDFAISWDDQFTEMPTAKSIKLSELTVLGLDTLYASHTGGPVRLTETEIMEQLRYGMIQVVGNVTIEGFDDSNEFAVEISDFAFDATIDAADKIKLDAVGWRFLEFSCPSMEFLPIESLVVGYLLKKLPNQLKSHLISVYDGGATKLNQELEDDSFGEEQPIDGKYTVNSDEMIANDQQKLQGGAEIVSDEDYSKMQLNQEIDEVKLHKIDVKEDIGEHEKMNLNGPNSQEDHLAVQLHDVQVLPEQNDQGHVQLNNIVAEPEVEDQDEVKIHHVEAIPHTEDKESTIPDKKQQLKLTADDSEKDDVQVQLKNVNVVSGEEDQGHVQLHQVLSEPGVGDHEEVKLHHVIAEPEAEDQGIIKLNHVEAKPNIEEEGLVLLHDVQVVEDDGTPGENKDKKTPRAVARKKLPIKGQMRTLNKKTKVIKRANSKTNNKTTHMLDNEIKTK